jgi:cytochrome P450
LANLAAANRDPETFACPAKFDAKRDPNPNVSFGLGPHFCVGAALSRLEAVIALELFGAAYPNARLRDQSTPPVWEGQGFRRLPRLLVRLR